MKLSEFHHAVSHQFGAHGAVLLRDLVLPTLGNRSAAEAIDAGIDTGTVWAALCEAADVPQAARVPVRLPQERG